MKRVVKHAALLLVPLVAVLYLLPGMSATPATVVVTTSMLESAVDELAPVTDQLRVVRLVPPGSCPGQFDLSPRSVPVLRAAEAVIRHDFQDNLEAKLRDAGVAGATVVSVESEGSLLVPERYAALVGRVAAVLSELFPATADAYATAAAAAEQRLTRLGEEFLSLARSSSPWWRAPAIVSARQAELSRWLGLEVVAELGRGEDVAPRELQRLLQLQPALVVANLQEGVRPAATLANRLGTPLVVLSSFPGADGYGDGYEQLLRGNLQRLDAAWRSR